MENMAEQTKNTDIRLIAHTVLILLKLRVKVVFFQRYKIVGRTLQSVNPKYSVIG